jgi:hypothetical protein
MTLALMMVPTIHLLISARTPLRFSLVKLYDHQRKVANVSHTDFFGRKRQGRMERWSRKKNYQRNMNIGSSKTFPMMSSGSFVLIAIRLHGVLDWGEC